MAAPDRLRALRDLAVPGRRAPRRRSRRLILTASGGPFLDRAGRRSPRSPRSRRCAHPTWSMGAKITIDSATLANKGLEVVEAHWLYDVEYDAIDVVVHPQSVVHSAVQFVDGSLKAQLGTPDMRLPIQYALTHPDRLPSPAAAARPASRPRGSTSASPTRPASRRCGSPARPAARAPGDGRADRRRRGRRGAVPRRIARLRGIPRLLEAAVDGSAAAATRRRTCPSSSRSTARCAPAFAAARWRSHEPDRGRRSSRSSCSSSSWAGSSCSTSSATSSPPGWRGSGSSSSGSGSRRAPRCCGPASRRRRTSRPPPCVARPPSPPPPTRTSATRFLDQEPAPPEGHAVHAELAADRRLREARRRGRRPRRRPPLVRARTAADQARHPRRRRVHEPDPVARDLHRDRVARDAVRRRQVRGGAAGSPAADRGLEGGDAIVTINGVKFDFFARTTARPRSRTRALAGQPVMDPLLEDAKFSFPGICLGIGNQVLHVSNRQRIVDHEVQRHADQQGDVREILDRVERHLRHEARQDHVDRGD